MRDSTRRARTSTRARQARNRRILATTNTCHICGHQGSDAIDHIIPITARPDLADHPDNLAPAHHTLPCATCGKRCNLEKGSKPHAPIIRTVSGVNW